MVLVGGGEFGSKASFEESLAAANGHEVLVIPTAAAFERPERAVETARRALEPHGITVRELPLYERAQAFEAELVEQVSSARVAYLIGGSPFHLRAVLRATPVCDALRAAIAAGLVLLASSAGAMVLGDPMVDPRGGALTVGLGIIERLAVIPHADTWPRDLKVRTAHLAPPDVTVAEIDEQTGLVVHGDGSLATVGPGRVRLSRAGLELDLASERLSLALAR